MLVSDVVALLKSRFTDLTTNDAITYINMIHRELMGNIPEASKGALDIDIVANQASYSLSSDIVEVQMVICRVGGSNKLNRTSEDILMEETPNWGSDAAGTPIEFYVVGDLGDPLTNDSTLKIVLHPKPAADLTAGLRVYFTQVQTMIGTDTLPGGIATYRVYLEGASYLAMEAMRGPGTGGFYYQMYVNLINICAERWHKMIPQWPLISSYPINRTK